MNMVKAAVVTAVIAACGLGGTAIVMAQQSKSAASSACQEKIDRRAALIQRGASGERLTPAEHEVAMRSVVC